jgi:hypothetical protein
MKTLRIYPLILLFIFITNYYNCQKNVSGPHPNETPTTTIANVPIDGDTLFALVQLQWDGGDNDGYIKGFEYKYTTYYSDETGNFDTNAVDSLVQPWEFTDQTQLTIAFNSFAKLNKQRFQVRSVDDKGAKDPLPAEKMLYTIQTIPPVVEILTPENNAKAFVKQQVTDWWQGILLKYQGNDEDGEIIEYGWSIDGSDWVWTNDSTMYITPDLLATPLEGQHTIQVIARDNTNILSVDPATIKINLVEPTFNKNILIIDETNEKDFPSNLRVSDGEVDSLYADIFGVYDSDDWWDYEYHELRDQPVPDLQTLGQYKMVIWHADNRPSQDPHKFVDHEDYLKDYLNIGGDLILSGWRILKSFAWDETFPVNFSDDSFVKEYLHIKTADETPYFPGDFTGARAAFGTDFIELEVDSTKVPGFPFNGNLSNINIITYRAGFTEVFYTYLNPMGSALYQYRGQPCALKYTGTVFNSVVLGFPLYFIKEDQSKILGEQILKSLGYL